LPHESLHGIQNLKQETTHTMKPKQRRMMKNTPGCFVCAVHFGLQRDQQSIASTVAVEVVAFSPTARSFLASKKRLDPTEGTMLIDHGANPARIRMGSSTTTYLPLDNSIAGRIFVL
jgi:hypothetical protein